jgi:Spy/CpxP family protein refolding chaperone
MISKNEMIARISHALDKIPNLTKEQKQAVHDIHAEVLTQSWDINHKIRQNKILLFNYLGEEKYNSRKVNYVKKEVEKLYKKKLKIMIASFNKLKKILGKDTSKILKQHDFMRTHGVNLKEF